MKTLIRVLIAFFVSAPLHFGSAPAFGQAAAPTLEAPPVCNAFTEGKNLTFGHVGNVFGVHWWCAPNGQFGNWQSARAAVVLDPSDPNSMSGIQDKIDTKDFAGLVKARDRNTSAPEFAPLWASMSQRIKNSKPGGPWTVAKNGTAYDRPTFKLEGTKLLANPTRAAVGGYCNCAAKRIASGTTIYCQVGADPVAVSVCTKE
jgi:hypothetical protein